MAAPPPAPAAAANPPADIPAENQLRAWAFRPALLMVLNHDGFIRINSHLTLQERRNLRLDPPVWPGTKPVFSPYATTKPTAYYTQVKPTADQFLDITRHSVYVHRMTCNWKWGRCPVPGYQASHRLGTGIPGIERDFNPNNLCWESERLNKSRGFCQIYFEQLSIQLSRGGHLTPAQVFTMAAQATHIACQVAHIADKQPNDRPMNFLCHFWDPAWGVISPLVRLHSAA